MKTIQLYLFVLGFFLSFQALSAQTAAQPTFAVAHIASLEEEFIACQQAKNKIEEAYISLHKVYVSKDLIVAQKDLQEAVKSAQAAKKETSKCPCQMANHITTEVVATLKEYKKSDDLAAIQDLAKEAMLQTRDAMIEIRNDKLAKF